MPTTTPQPHGANADEPSPRSPVTGRPPAELISGVNYDSGFDEAVAAGFMTPLQAMHRGDRDAFASRLEERHGLSAEAALLVTDHRLSLHEAVRRKTAALEAHARQQPRPKPPRLGPWILGVVAACCIGLVLFSWSLWTGYLDSSRRLAISSHRQQILHEKVARLEEDARPDAAPRASSVLVRKNHLGQVTEITGPDARAVLLSFCGIAFSGCTEPTELASPVPHTNNRMIGVFRNDSMPPELQAISIRRESRTRRWIAGNGLDPIYPIDNLRLAASRRRISVETDDRPL